MKINKTKVMVTTLALAMGAALAGSISGSVAWYQYSTRASAQLAGTSAGTSRELQVKEASAADYAQHVELGTKNYRPASFATISNVGGFYEKPVYKTASQPAVVDNERQVPNSDPAVYTVAYAEYELVFKCEDNGEQVAKDVYLSGFELTSTSTEDITPAVRVRIDGTNDFIIAATAGTTSTHGSLDLNGNGNADTDDILVTDQFGNPITYYAGAVTSDYAQVAPATAMPVTANPYQFSNKDNKVLTSTLASGDSAAVKVQVWIEGWQALGAAGSESTIWDAAYIAQSFNLKLQFACEADYE